LFIQDVSDNILSIYSSVACLLGEWLHLAKGVVFFFFPCHIYRSLVIRPINLMQVACKSLPLLAKEFFSPIFAVCFAVHCGDKPGKESGGTVLHSSILHIAEISELERDELIKKNMVWIRADCFLVLSVVSFLIYTFLFALNLILFYMQCHILFWMIRYG